jgi:hypothetical protein
MNFLYSMAIWNIIRPFGIFSGHLVISWQFGIFSLVLVCSIKKNLATLNPVSRCLQDTTVLLQKTKEIYKQRCLELEKLKRDNASTKELEKSEAKFRKAQVREGRLDWANFTLLGDCLLRAFLQHTQGAQIALYKLCC